MLASLLGIQNYRAKPSVRPSDATQGHDKPEAGDGSNRVKMGGRPKSGGLKSNKSPAVIVQKNVCKLSKD